MLADLLMKIMEDYTKAPDIAVLDTPNSFDSRKLATQLQLSSVVDTLCGELKMDISIFPAPWWTDWV